METSKQQFILADWKFADPKVDYAFKRIFGTEKYKDATINLINTILPHLHIVDVEYTNTELVGDTGATHAKLTLTCCAQITQDVSS